MTAAVAVSGGRDSLLALALLRQRQHDLVAVHAQLASKTAPEVLDGLRQNCRILGVPFLSLDLRSRFEELVVAPYVQSYLAGRTPNPCVWCNVRIKFGLLLDAVRAQGVATLATGHYARLEPEGSRTALWRGEDRAKDQSYFLAMLDQSQLASAVFPLAAHNKKEVLAELKHLQLTPPLPSESQEVCFIPGDYRIFLRDHLPQQPVSGQILHVDGQPIGTHQGLWRYTVGQRKGLDVPWSEPLYVLRKDLAANRLIVGERNRLLRDICCLESINYLVPFAAWPRNLHLQTRYRQHPEQVSLAGPSPSRSSSQPDRLVLCYRKPCEPAAPGQIGVVYTSEGQVLAGGLVQS